MTNAERRQQWEERIAAFKSSGQSKKAWCEEHNIPQGQFYYWLKKLSAKEPEPKTQWLPVTISDEAQANPSLRVRIGQAVVEVEEGFSQKLLTDVVRTLTELC